MQDADIELNFFDRRTFEKDPYPTLKYLRDNHPAYNFPGTNRWILTRYDDVADAFRDTENYSASPNAQIIDAVIGTTLIEMDGTEHKKRRNIISPVFIGKNLERMMPMIRKNVAAAIDTFTRKHARIIAETHAKVGEIELVEDFATRLPLNVITDMLDLPREVYEELHRWYPAMIRGMVDQANSLEEGQQANAEFHEVIQPLVEQRIKTPGDDLISRLIVAEIDGAKLTVEEIKSFASQLFVAGADTTDKAIANLWYMLLTNPDQFALVQEDPDLVERAFFEMMRIHGPSGAQTREAIRDIHIHGQTIPAGSWVMLSQWGANRDERVFKDPDRFDIMRDDLELKYGARNRKSGRAGHLGFGLGAHFCIGFHLAQIETVVGTQELMKVLKNPRIKPGTHPVPIAVSPRTFELHVEFDVA